MLSEIIHRICELTGAREAHGEDNLRAVGVDSLTYIRLIVEIENEHGIEFDDEELASTNEMTVNDFVNIVERKCKKEN